MTERVHLLDIIRRIAVRLCFDDLLRVAQFASPLRLAALDSAMAVVELGPFNLAASRAIDWLQYVVCAADLSGIVGPDGRRLEVKSELGAQRREQANYERLISTFGGIYILARSIDDVHAGLEAEGYERADG